MSVLTERCTISAYPVFSPQMCVISAITNANTAQVTTTTDHGYVDGTIVKFSIPTADGMYQIDQMATPIIVTGDTTFSTSIDSTLFEPFAIPVAPNVHTNICALVIPIGENNDTLEAAVHNIL